MFLNVKTFTLRLTRSFSFVRKSDLDWSKRPELNEKDLEEKFTNGSGPGGQNVNKRVNCVFLRHIPTGLAIKCHQSRELEKNRKIARDLLIDKLDELLNGEQSISAQKDRLYKLRQEQDNAQANKRREAKRKYKELLKNTKKPSESNKIN